jgi:hypothetical protein
MAKKNFPKSFYLPSVAMIRPDREMTGRGRPRAEPATTRAEKSCGQTIIFSGVERSDRNKK